MTDRKGKDGAIEKRRHRRFALPENLRATITDKDDRKTDVVVKDISAGGAGLILDGAFDNEAFVELHVEGLGHIPARVARATMEGMGVQFETSEKERKAMEEELVKFRKTVARKKF